MNIDFVNTQPPILETDLTHVEQTFGFKFPEDFRKLYLLHNGGRPQKNRFVDQKGPCVLHEFLPIKYSTRPVSTLESSIARLRDGRRCIPDFLVQFAVDPSGDYYCFSIREDEHGAIYFVHMDSRDSSRRVEYLANSLHEFLGKLTARTT
jgi:hypothetical protein